MYEEWIIPIISILVAIAALVISISVYNHQKRSDVSIAYANILNGIIELKIWAHGNSHILGKLNNHPFMDDRLDRNHAAVVDSFNYAGANTVEEFLDMRFLFYHLEHIFFQAQNKLIPENNRKGLENEIEIWLTLPGAAEHYRFFCKVNKTEEELKLDQQEKQNKQLHSEDFLDFIGEIHKKGRNDII